MSIILSEPTLGDLEIDDGALGYCVASVEVGGPEVRGVVNPRVLADGTTDRTRFVGSRSITIQMTVADDAMNPSRQVLLDQIAPYLHPGRRVDMAIRTDPAAPARLYRVRGADWSAPWEHPAYLTATFSWVTVGSPHALAGGPAKSVALGFAGSDDSGRTYNEKEITSGKWGREYVRDYPAGGVPTQAICVNDGNVPADFVAVVGGPVEGFTLVNLTTDEQLAFPGLEIPGGETVVIDSAAHTVLANGEPGSSRYSFIDFATSEWFKLQPGPNQIGVQSYTYSAPAHTTITWRDTYL